MTAPPAGAVRKGVVIVMTPADLVQSQRTNLSVMEYLSGTP